VSYDWLEEKRQEIADLVAISPAGSEQEESLRAQIFFGAFYGPDGEEAVDTVQVCFSCSREDAKALRTNGEARALFFGVNPGHHLGLMDNFKAWKKAWETRVAKRGQLGPDS